MNEPLLKQKDEGPAMRGFCFFLGGGSRASATRVFENTVLNGNRGLRPSKPPLTRLSKPPLHLEATLGPVTYL